MRILFVLNDPPTALMLKHGNGSGLPGMLSDCIRRAQSKFGAEIFLRGESIQIESISPYTCDSKAAAQALFPPPSPGASFDCAILSGSVFNVTDIEQHGWMQAEADWLRSIAEYNKACIANAKANEQNDDQQPITRMKPIPLFGICFGHQLMSVAFGGEVTTRTSDAGEWGSVLLCSGVEQPLDNDPVFGAALFTAAAGGTHGVKVNETHTQSVTKLPDGAVSLLKSKMDPIQAVRYSTTEQPMCYSCQFHPECRVAYIKEVIETADDYNPEDKFEYQTDKEDMSWIVIALFLQLVQNVRRT